MTILGLDVSHFQGSPNFAQVKASGREFVVLKATEGTTYVDPTFAANRRNAHAAGLIVGHYHFARGGNAAAEAAWFVRNIGALQPGEFLVLDWEITYAGDHVAWCKAWLDAVTAATGVAPLIYMNSSAMNGHNWMPLSGAHGLWLAKYDGSTSAPTACNCWPAAAMKQYSDKGAVPGVGSCDVNAFYGTAAQLLAYGKGGTPPPAPPIVQQEDDMAVLRDPSSTIWMWSGADLISTADGITSSVWQKAAGAYHDVTWPELDAVKFYVTSRRDRELVGAQNYILGANPKDKPYLYDRVVGLGGQVDAVAVAIGKAQAPVIDEAKLAAALLADPNAVQALGKAIADNLQLTPRANG